MEKRDFLTRYFLPENDCMKKGFAGATIKEWAKTILGTSKIDYIPVRGAASYLELERRVILKKNSYYQLYFQYYEPLFDFLHL